MRLLLDTHALLWWLTGDTGLSAASRAEIGLPEREVLVSSASFWEIATKVRLGRLPQATTIVSDLPGIAQSQGFRVLPISADHALRAGLLPGEHRDPFDRMLAAQAQLENLVLVSNDIAFDQWCAFRLW